VAKFQLSVKGHAHEDLLPIQETFVVKFFILILREKTLASIDNLKMQDMP
jgi:hypothetical protein